MRHMNAPGRSRRLLRSSELPVPVLALVTRRLRLVSMESSEGPVTAVRALDRPTTDACTILTPATFSYSDGAEERVYDVIRDAADLSSMSDELAAQATNWAERYHLATSRANLLRPFGLPEDSVVLEIGAGCGAITRYLGERCGWVDALEPVLSRARAARARVRDLSNVEVFVGSLDDLPDDPGYDLVVVVGVLEYVGEGSADLGPQRNFLRQIEGLLRPGGSLLLAIENKLGVKYLAGAGEDHTGRVYDSVEGYPAGTIARTFSRSELTGLLESAGLAPSFYCAFPDYKLPRAILSDALFASVPPLAWRIPQFPSPDRSGTWSHAVNEERLWRALVQDGLGPSFGNSFVVSARKGPGRDDGDDLWPLGQLAAFYQPDRRAAYATQTLVCERDGTTVFRRSPLRSSPAGSRPSLGRLLDAERVHEETALVLGTDLLEVLERADDDRLASYMWRWVAIAESEAAERGGYEPDLLPHNLVETTDGSLKIIDREWIPSVVSRDEFLARGVLQTALKLVCRTPPSRWSCDTFREAAVHIGEMVGLDPSGDWLVVAVQREAELQAEVLIETGWYLKAPTQLESIRRTLEETLAMPLSWLPLGSRDHERLTCALEANERSSEGYKQLADAYEQLVAERDAIVAESDAIKASGSWRLTEPVRAVSKFARRRPQPPR
jgi:SAM-dependent methyltransferase